MSPADRSQDLSREPDVIIASGAILTRLTPDGPTIAVIHRPVYGDWCLPKGKMKENESLKETAVREIGEETKCRAVITGFAGVTTYAVRNIPKTVYFWNMSVTHEDTFIPNNEVDRLLWLSPQEALKQLTHANEKRLVTHALSLQESPDRQATFARRLWMCLRSGSPRISRLKGSILTYRMELEFKRRRFGDDPHQQRIDCLELALEALRTAEGCADRGDLDTGWRCLFAAQRLEIEGMNDEELAIRAKGVADEARKITSWRGDTIRDLLKKEPDQKTAPGAGRVSYAMFMLHDYYCTAYHKIALLSHQLAILAGMLSVIVLVIIVLAISDNLPTISVFSAVSREMILAVILFGAAGGAVSSCLSIMRTSTSSTIPAQIATWPLTLMRVLVGASSALVLYALINSDLWKSIFSVEIDSVGGVLFVSFAAGFSERLVQRAVTYIADKKS